jgi:hypothetical protein
MEYYLSACCAVALICFSFFFFHVGGAIRAVFMGFRAIVTFNHKVRDIFGKGPTILRAGSKRSTNIQ